MLELELTNAKSTLEDWAPKDDKVGPYVQLRISCDLDYNILAEFSDDLKDRVFKLNEDLAGGVLQIADSGEVYPMSRAESMFGALLKLQYGLGQMDFADAVIDDFKISPIDGGGVILAFHAKIRPSEGQVDKLYHLRKQSITVTLEPMEQPVMREAA